MYCFVRVDSGSCIGTGHVMRCLNIVNYLTKINPETKVIFICKNHQQSLINLIKNNNYHIHLLPVTNQVTFDLNTWLGGDWTEDVFQTIKIIKKYDNSNISRRVIVDHYAIDYQWEDQLKKYIPDCQLVCIDEMKNNKHSCDILIDQMYFKKDYLFYDQLVPKTCLKLIGLDYLMLNEKILDYRTSDRLNSTQIKQILVTFGGSDIYHLTDKVIDLFKQNNLLDSYQLHVVIGSCNINKDQLKQINQPGICLYEKLSNIEMFQLMNKCDICIGTIGVSAFERFCLGLPTFTIVSAENQIHIAKEMAKEQLIYLLGNWKNWNQEILVKTLSDPFSEASLKSVKKLRQTCQKAFEQCDGYGVNRIAQVILEK